MNHYAANPQHEVNRVILRTDNGVHVDKINRERHQLQKRQRTQNARHVKKATYYSTCHSLVQSDMKNHERNGHSLGVVIETHRW